MAQVYNIPVTRAFTNLGKIGAGFQLFFFETGTTTKKTVFAEAALITSLTNPVIADANGYFPQIFMESTGNDYKAVLSDDTDTDPPTSPIFTADPVEVDANDINAFGTRPAQHWGTTTNTAADYQISPKTALAAYTDDLLFSLEIHLNSTGAGTLAVEDLNDLGNFLTALDIKKYDGAGGKVDIEAGDLLTNQTYLFRIDMIDAVVLNPEIIERAINNTLIIPDNGELTIAAGVITITDSQHTVDTEADAATDNLDTINGGTTGQILLLSIENSARDVVIKHATGNIITDTQTDIELDLTNDLLLLQFNGTNWIVLSRSVNNDFRSSKAGAGFTFLPNGLIFQWGVNNITGAGTNITVALPVTYPNAHFLSVGQQGPANAASLIDGVVGANPLSVSQIRIMLNFDSGTAAVRWWSVGN